MAESAERLLHPNKRPFGGANRTITSTLVIRVAALMGVCLATSPVAMSQDLAQVLKGLDQAKARILSGRAMAEIRIRTSGPFLLDEPVANPTDVSASRRETRHWAYAGEKYYLGSRSASSSWDGVRRRRRQVNPDGKGYGEVRHGVGFSTPYPEDPISLGYKAAWKRWGNQWLCDLVRLERPSIKALGGRKVQLIWTDRSDIGTNVMAVVVDPNRGYMAESITTTWNQFGRLPSAAPPQNGDGGIGPEGAPAIAPRDRAAAGGLGKPPEVSVSAWRVLEAEAVGGRWIPTHFVLEAVDPATRKRTITMEWVSTNIRADFNDGIFGVFQPGDTVREDLKEYRVAESGELVPLPAAKTGEELAAEAIRREFYLLIAGVAGAALAAFFLAKASMRWLAKR